MNARRLVAFATILFVGPASCVEGPPPPASEGSGVAVVDSSGLVAPANLPLRELMQGLERDLATVAHGIWLDDSKSVAQGAGRVADHPRAMPNQVGIIQSTLGGEFASFVQQDQKVHHDAAALAELAAASVPAAQLFDQYVRVQEGCISCHMQFRARVSEALAATADEP